MDLVKILKDFDNPDFNNALVELVANKKETYFLQDKRSYVGNNMLWWSKKGGYTCNIEDAEEFSKEKAMKSFKDRMTDVPYKSSDIRKNCRKVVDMQYVVKDDSDKFYSDLEKLKKVQNIIVIIFQLLILKHQNKYLKI